MDTWELILQMMKMILEEQTATMDITITENGIKVQVLPLFEGDEEDD